MEHLKENVEDLSDDKIFEEMMKIVQEKSLQKFGKTNNRVDERNQENISKNEDEDIEGENQVYKDYKESKEETEPKISANKVELSDDDEVKICEENNCDNEVELEMYDVEEEKDGNPVEVIIDDDDVQDPDEMSETESICINAQVKSALKSYRSKSKKLLRCPYCPYRANHPNHLRTHIPAIHSSLTCYRCPLCPPPSRTRRDRPPFFSHSQLSALRTHLDRKHRDRKFECPECQKKFTTLWNCEGHIAIRHAETAGRIQKVLRMRENIRKSMGNYVDGPRKTGKQCPYCDFEGSSANVVRKHVVGKHEPWLVYKCARCEYRAELVEILRKHVDEKHNDDVELTMDLDEEEEQIEQVVLIC